MVLCGLGFGHPLMGLRPHRIHSEELKMVLTEQWDPQETG